MEKKIDFGKVALAVSCAVLFFVIHFMGAIPDCAIIEEENTSLKQEYEEYVKENEWKNEYIEWLQDQLYEKYEGVE